MLPGDGQPVAAAVTSWYPPVEDGADPSTGEQFWLVMPMHFARVHLIEDSDEAITDCFVDSDFVIRRPFGGPGTDDVVTHWTELPPLPGTTDHRLLLGEDAQEALDSIRMDPAAGV